MKFEKEALKILSYIAIGAANEAGAYIRSRIGDDVKVHKKEAIESLAAQVVTEVDWGSQNFILNTLHESCSEYDIGLLSEEDEDDNGRFESEYFWCIDPLDGTLQFTESRKGFSVSIALVSREGEPIIGVVYDPVENNLYYAVKGQGAFRNHERWNINAEDNREPKIIEEGGAVMNACWAIEQSPAVFYKKPKATEGGGCLWDYAATACIYKELGAWVSDMYGQPLELNRKESTFMNHKGVLYATHEKYAKPYIIGESNA